MIKRCWSQNPQKRPEISEVVLCLRATLALRHDRVGLDDDRAQAGMTSGSTQRRGLSLGGSLSTARYEVMLSVIGRATFLAIPLDVRFFHTPTTFRVREVLSCTPIYLRRGIDVRMLGKAY